MSTKKSKPPPDPPPKKRGRPPGSGTGKTTRTVHVSVPLDVADWLDEQPNKSAVVTSALRALMPAKKPARSRR